MSGTRERLWLPLLFVLAGFGVLAQVLLDERNEALGRIHFEDEARRRVLAVAEAQKRHHARHGRYGWLEDIEEDASIRSYDTVEDSDGLRLASPRYRIDVLLPFSVSAGEVVTLAPRSEGRTNPRLEKHHFAVVARPVGPDLTGHRSYYLDEAGALFVSDGVCDAVPMSERPLPNVHLTAQASEMHMERGLHIDVAGLRWFKLDRLPTR